MKKKLCALFAAGIFMLPFSVDALMFNDVTYGKPVSVVYGGGNHLAYIVKRVDGSYSTCYSCGDSDNVGEAARLIGMEIGDGERDYWSSDDCIGLEGLEKPNGYDNNAIFYATKLNVKGDIIYFGEECIRKEIERR